MKKLFMAGFAIAAVSSSIYASTKKNPDTAKSSLLVQPPHDVSVNEVLVLQTKPGHHFNLQAPQKCGDTMPIKKEALEIQCQFPNPGEQKIVVYICDDGKTFCKPETYKIHVTASKERTTGTETTPASQTKNVAEDVKEEHSAPSEFIRNNPLSAQQLAQKQNKLLFVDFYAIWCPPCNMYDEFVFSAKNFATEANNFVLTQVDVDSEVSWPLKERFKIGVYPTIVIATPQYEEIGRLVGYHSKSDLLNWLQKQYELRAEPVKVAEQKVNEWSKNSAKYSSVNNSEKTEMEARKLRVGIWHYERGEYETALSYVNDLNSDEAKRYQMLSTYEMAAKDNNTGLVAKTLVQLVQTYPDDIDLADRVLELGDYDHALLSKFLPAVEKNLNYWKAHTNKNEPTNSLGSLYETNAKIYDALNKPELAKKLYLDCANYFAELSKLSINRVARGANIEQASCLVRAGKSKEAKVLFEQMAEEYKDEFTFNYYYARTLKTLNELDAAHKYVSLAYKTAYGDNLLRTATLKAGIEIAMKQNKMARTTIQSTLDKANLPDSKQLRTHRYVTELKNMLAEL